jgi:hypothetical protein
VSKWFHNLKLIDFGTCLQNLTIPYGYFTRVRRILPALTNRYNFSTERSRHTTTHWPFHYYDFGYYKNWSKSTFQHILMICWHYSHIQILNTKRILNFLGVWVLFGLSLHVQFLCVFIGMRWNITKQGSMLALSGQRIVAIQNSKLYVVLIITKSSVVQWWDTFSFFQFLPFLVLWQGNSVVGSSMKCKALGEIA